MYVTDGAVGARLDWQNRRAARVDRPDPGS
jgi:hypothetical protein